MTSDVVCVGRAYVDITFLGLPALPRPGEEKYATEIGISGGGSLTTAVGLARLGMHPALVAPIGEDLLGSHLKAILDREGVTLRGPSVPSTPLTVVFAIGADRAMATHESRVDSMAPYTKEFAGARAVISGISNAHELPIGAPSYLGCSAAAAESLAGRLPNGPLTGARAIIANEREALILTGASSVEQALKRLHDLAEVAVVTRGEHGAVATDGCDTVASAAPDVPVRDTTGAGDLFVAAFVWADLAGAPLGDCVATAVLYSALSVGKPTALGSVLTFPELCGEARRRGVNLPAKYEDSVSH